MHSHDQSAELLGAGGPFSRLIEGFRPRSTQVEMAAAVERCLRDNGISIVESGTGTGKTYAYLVPALLSDKKIIVSTGTKPLQDQLYFRDLPAVARALAVPARTALLKGRANYLCLQRLEAAMQQGDLLPDRRVDDLLSVDRWSKETKSGDTNELTGVPEDSSVWPLVTSTAENCLGAKCRHYEMCYVNRARREALTADVLVINHHLFCADLVLREDGFGRLLPGADAVIFDEAHQLPEIASAFLGTDVSASQIRELCRDTGTEERREQSLVEGLTAAVAQVERECEGLRAVIRSPVDRVEWAEVDRSPDFPGRLAALVAAVSDLGDLLEAAAPAGEGLLRCWQRALSCAERLCRFAEPAGDRVVRWAETGKNGFRFHETPIQPGDVLRPHLQDHSKAWFYTSATLSIDGDFGFFASQLGIAPTETLCLDSPFDYARQAQLYVPEGLPDPGQEAYTAAVVSAALPVIDIVGGRTFFLFTSHSALRQARELMQERSSYCLLVQGDMPRTELLHRFRTEKHAVLLGTSSFWQGVDVRGDALCCVIIDKLPFESPSDPVLRARLEAIESSGGNPFVDYQVPRAVIALKQGAGRLIRDSGDFGVLVLCDPRVLSRSYGRVFLRSLPAMPMTRNIGDVAAFFAAAAARG